MAVTLLAGVEQSTDNTANNPRDMAANVYDLEPNETPFTVFLDHIRGSKAAINPKIEWNENESMPRITTLSASATSAATTWGVTANIFRVNDVVRFTTNGFGVVVTATAAGAITATAIMTGAAAQVSAQTGAELYIVSNSNAEGATLREIKYPQLVTASNYTQIIRTPFGVTGTEDATDHYGGDERRRLQKFFGIDHARSIEHTFFFGSRDLINTNQRMCGGIASTFITTNATAQGGTLSEAQFQTFLRSAFRYGSSEKTLFCSPLLIAALEGYARTTINTIDEANTYGVRVKQYVSGQGVVNLVKKVAWNDSTVLTGYGVLVDMDAVMKRDLRATRLKTNVQAPDYDGMKDEYITETSLQVTHERRHAILTGVTGGA